MCRVMETCSAAGSSVPLTCAGNTKFSATKACNASRVLGVAASKRARISAGADFGTASAKVLLSGYSCALCTATNRFLNKTCGVSGVEAIFAGCDCACVDCGGADCACVDCN